MSLLEESFHVFCPMARWIVFLKNILSIVGISFQNFNVNLCIFWRCNDCPQPLIINDYGDFACFLQAVIFINFIERHQTKVLASSPCPMQILNSPLNLAFLYVNPIFFRWFLTVWSDIGSSFCPFAPYLFCCAFLVFKTYCCQFYILMLICLPYTATFRDDLPSWRSCIILPFVSTDSFVLEWWFTSVCSVQQLSNVSTLF